MVSHRQTDRATTTAAVYDDVWVEDPDSLDDGYYDEQLVLEDRDVQFVSGGQGWVPEGEGDRVYRNPTLDWPTTDVDTLDEGQEVTLGVDDHERRYVIERLIPVYGRYRSLDKVTVEISSI